MERNKRIAIIYYVASAMFFVSAAIMFFTSSAGFGAFWLALGAANLCLGSVWMKKYQDEKRDEESHSDGETFVEANEDRVLEDGTPNNEEEKK